MAERNIRLAAANMLLKRGMRFTISDAPFLWRLFRLNRVRIRPFYGGTLAEISRIMDENGLNDIFRAEQANAKLEAISLLIAVSILNGKSRIKWFSGRLSRLLLWKVPPHTLVDMFFRISSVNKVSDFMNITIYFGIQAQMMMSPKIAGQTEKGS